MVGSSSDLTHLALAALSTLIVLAGAALDLLFVFRFQRHSEPLRFLRHSEINERPFTLFHALQVLWVTLMCSVPVLFQKMDAPTPPERSIVLGPVLYALMSLLIVVFCLTTAKTTFRSAFASNACTAKQALAKGLVYGLAAIPPVVLLSTVISSITEAFGYEARLQNVFDWLNDGAVSSGTRVFMMFSAVFIAPVAEEALFRGILLPSLLKFRSLIWAALVSSFYFALVHFHAPSLLPLILLGLAFSAAYAKTGSLLTPIVMHALFNATSLLFFLAGKT